MAEPNQTPERRRYTITVEIPASDGVDEVLEAIASIDGDQSIRDVRSTGEQTIRIDTNELTELQRETLSRAVEMGYYSSPRAVRLDELCETFDVSKSAVSQRLRKAESTLVQRVVSEMAPEISQGNDEAETVEENIV